MGWRYRLEFKNDLSAVAWTPVPGEITGDGSVQSLTDTSAPGTQRFYRLVRE